MYDYELLKHTSKTKVVNVVSATHSLLYSYKVRSNIIMMQDQHQKHI